MDFNQVFDALIKSYSNNEFFVGMISSGIILGISYTFRNIPYNLFNLFLRYFSIEIQVDNRSESYAYFNMWLNDNIGYIPRYTISGNIFKDNKIEKRNGLSRYISYGREGSHNSDSNGIYPGFGYFWFVWNNKFVIINRFRTTEGTTDRPLDTLKVRIFFPGKSFKNDIILNLKEYDLDDNIIRIYTWDMDYWNSSGTFVKRPVNSIYMDETQKHRILDDIKQFFEDHEWYANKGIPYKRGYLLYGPPGCGKTSLIKLIASELNKDIRYINIPAITSDRELASAFNEIPRGSIVVIEDFDCVSVIERSEKSTEVENKISLSTFLNITDGLLSSEGSIIIYTTNYKDKIDSAMKRPGRIDVIERIGMLTEIECKRMISDFYNMSNIDIIFPNDFEISGANIQKLLILNKDSFDAFKIKLDKIFEENAWFKSNFIIE